MIRYINKQKHKASCGPIATMNLLKWLGAKINYNYLNLFTIFGYEHGLGFHPKDQFITLNIFGIKHEVNMQPTVQYMRQEIKKGNAIILIYNKYYPIRRHYGKRKIIGFYPLYHSVFIPEITHKKYFKTLNNGTSRISFKNLDSYLKFSYKACHDLPIVISIPKQ